MAWRNRARRNSLRSLRRHLSPVAPMAAQAMLEFRQCPTPDRIGIPCGQSMPANMGCPRLCSIWLTNSATSPINAGVGNYDSRPQCWLRPKICVPISKLLSKGDSDTSRQFGTSKAAFVATFHHGPRAGLAIAAARGEAHLGAAAGHELGPSVAAVQPREEADEAVQRAALREGADGQVSQELAELHEGQEALPRPLLQDELHGRAAGAPFGLARLAPPLHAEDLLECADTLQLQLGHALLRRLQRWRLAGGRRRRAAEGVVSVGDGAEAQHASPLGLVAAATAGGGSGPLGVVLVERGRRGGLQTEEVLHLVRVQELSLAVQHGVARHHGVVSGEGQNFEAQQQLEGRPLDHAQLLLRHAHGAESRDADDGGLEGLDGDVAETGVELLEVHGGAALVPWSAAVAARALVQASHFMHQRRRRGAFAGTKADVDAGAAGMRMVLPLLLPSPRRPRRPRSGRALGWPCGR
eukprot:scaffold1311_cov256-Pinguiococcus_pyrenoidosus.AAC.41